MSIIYYGERKPNTCDKCGRPVCPGSFCRVCQFNEIMRLKELIKNELKRG